MSDSLTPQVAQYFIKMIEYHIRSRQGVIRCSTFNLFVSLTL
jgi:hypothetical protein